MKVWIEGGTVTGAYAYMFQDEGWEVVDQFNEADLVLFTGGQDVSPALYGEKCHKTTHYNVQRDNYCQYVYQQAIEQGKAIAGICRGAQFLNVMNGGKLWQNVNGHLGNHIARAYGYGSFIVSSTHHQMMRPADDGIVRLIAEQGNIKETMPPIYSPDDEPIVYRFEPEDEKEDVESVFYPKTKTYCYQPHPEFAGVPECRKFFFDELKNLLRVGV